MKKDPITVRRIPGATFILLVVFAAAPPAAAQFADAPPGTARTDRLLVMPEAGADLDALHALLGTTVLRKFSEIGNLQIVQLPPGQEVTAAIALYEESGLVEYAEPDLIVQAVLTPNDFRYWDGSLWGLHNTGVYGGTPRADIKAPEGWDVQHAAPGLIVADIDTGVRYTHEDLAANMWVNPGESGPDLLGLDRRLNGRDDDGNGYLDDVHGINAILGTGMPLDDYGHGTHVAGTIGARGDNSVGVVGVAWQVQIMACKFLDSAGRGAISDAIACLDYARSKGARVVNASWGGCTFASAALFDAIDSLRSAGILFIAACGNDNVDNDVSPLYPASYALDNIVAVAATDRTDSRAWFSNYGARKVHLGAPGAAIFSCWNGSDNDYRTFDGTSMAAPHVSGACALVWARYPGDTYLQIKSRVLHNTDPLPSLAGKTVTGGRLNLFKALSVAPPPPPALPIVTVGASNRSAAEARRKPGTFTLSRTGNTAAPLAVSYMLGGTAQNGADYQTLSGTATIPAGAGSAKLLVKPLDDRLAEGAEGHRGHRLFGRSRGPRLPHHHVRCHDRRSPRHRARAGVR